MRAPRFNPLHLAGWLFADMLLVLALVAMGDRGDPLAAEAVAKPGSSASAKPKPSKAPKPKGPRSVVNKPVKVSIDAAPGDKSHIKQRLRAVTAPYRGRQAAFVLTFGRHADPGAGGAYAHEVNTLLGKARPDMFKGATTRDFWKGGSSSGHADIEIYFYTY
ncbi:MULTISPECIES: hypothetical protein [unclassified Streptomyces]|jgi:hypothetical protein|uniref:hypothetical protein n=1 Tax=unclassified Streptomyces TaxID=2593676 RepID=UPI00203447BA|nr:hypothetical protein [Streptomyces sp. RKAG290]MCM2413715.1 hypothetical protein [Streptomyces sp. RKAG290]